MPYCWMMMTDDTTTNYYLVPVVFIKANRSLQNEDIYLSVWKILGFTFSVNFQDYLIDRQ